MTLVFDPVKALDHVVTLGVAFAGVTAAFLLERYRVRRDERARNIASINKALYTLSNLWDIQEQLRREIVEDWRGKPDAWLNMPAAPPVRHGLTAFDTEGLSFLLGKSSELYAQLMLEEQRFHSLTYLVDERSRVTLQEAWPRLGAAGLTMGASAPGHAVEAALGPHIVRRLKVYTDSISSHVYENLTSLTSTYDQVRGKAIELFPNKHKQFLQIEFQKKP